MASKRRQRRLEVRQSERECGTKRKHETQESAIGHLMALKRKKGAARMTAYKCPHCGSWHVGHTTAKNRRERAKRIANG